MFLFTFGPVLAYAREDSAPLQYEEHQVKAAFLYNFIKFTDWPADKFAEPNTLAIGILGEDPFGNAFETIKGKTIQNRKLVIKQFGKFSDLCKDTIGDANVPCFKAEDLRKCHLLFVSKSEKQHFEKIIKAVSGASVLTIGENDGFLEAGGIINFIPKVETLAFEINMTASKQEGLRISSQVLRLALRVIGAESGKQLEIGPVFARLVSLKNL